MCKKTEDKMQVFVLCKKLPEGITPQVFQDQAKALLAYRELNTDENSLEIYETEMDVVL